MKFLMPVLSRQEGERESGRAGGRTAAGAKKVKSQRHWTTNSTSLQSSSPTSSSYSSSGPPQHKMRLFPPASAEPEHRHVYESLESIPLIAALSLLIPSKRVAIVLKCLAYGTAASIPIVVHNRYVEQRIASHFLRSENGDVPRAVFVDRLSHFDLDNAVILGGLVSGYNLICGSALLWVQEIIL